MARPNQVKLVGEAPLRNSEPINQGAADINESAREPGHTILGRQIKAFIDSLVDLYENEGQAGRQSQQYETNGSTHAPLRLVHAGDEHHDECQQRVRRDYCQERVAVDEHLATGEHIIHNGIGTTHYQYADARVVQPTQYLIHFLTLYLTQMVGSRAAKAEEACKEVNAEGPSWCLCQHSINDNHILYLLRINCNRLIPNVVK